jgi:hypothetical protein
MPPCRYIRRSFSCWRSFFPHRTHEDRVVGFYALAKVLEALDKPIFSLGHIVSGHTLKHLVAATAAYWIVRMLQKQRPAPWALHQTPRSRDCRQRIISDRR